MIICSKGKNKVIKIYMLSQGESPILNVVTEKLAFEYIAEGGEEVMQISQGTAL